MAKHLTMFGLFGVHLSTRRAEKIIRISTVIKEITNYYCRRLKEIVEIPLWKSHEPTSARTP